MLPGSMSKACLRVGKPYLSHKREPPCSCTSLHRRHRWTDCRLPESNCPRRPTLWLNQWVCDWIGVWFPVLPCKTIQNRILSSLLHLDLGIHLSHYQVTVDTHHDKQNGVKSQSAFVRGRKRDRQMLCMTVLRRTLQFNSADFQYLKLQSWAESGFSSHAVATKQCSAATVWLLGV